MNDHMIDAIKAAPPVAVSGLSFIGIPINDLIAVATLTYVVLLVVVLVRDKIWRPYFGRKE